VIAAFEPIDRPRRDFQLHRAFVELERADAGGKVWPCRPTTIRNESVVVEQVVVADDLAAD
jgi:hypothetical protein